MKRIIPIIIIIILLLVAVLLFVYCTMSGDPPPDVSEPHNRIGQDLPPNDTGNDTDPGRLEQPPAGSTDDEVPGVNTDDLVTDGDPNGDPDNLMLTLDHPVEINVMPGTWHVEAVSTIGEVSLRDTTMTFDESNHWTINGTVTLTVPGLAPISTPLQGGGTYTYDPAESALIVNNETYDSKEICHVDVIDENTLFITIIEYIGAGEPLYNAYTLTRV